MEIPQGSAREDIKARRQIIKDFYARWMSEHPEKKVWNKSLHAYINVKNDSVNEALGHAPRSVEATSAQLHLTEILSDAVYTECRPPKYGNNNQKKFSKMLFLKWKSSRVLVGRRKNGGEYELYYISGGQKIKPSGNGFENGARTKNGRVVIPSNEIPFDESCCKDKNES